MRPETSGRTIRRLCLAEFVYWIGNTTYYSYLVSFLRARSLSNTQAGLVLSVSAFLLLGSLPVWGAVSDSLRSAKKVLLMMAGASALILAYIPWAGGAALTAAAVCLLAVFESGFVSMLDGFVVQSIQGIPGASFGKIRIWGAVGAAIALAGSGAVLDRLPLICWIYAAVLCVVALLLRGVPDRPAPVRVHAGRACPAELLRIRPYVAFVLFVSLLFIPFRFTQSFLVSIVEGAGGNARTLQFALLAGSFSEGLFYILSSRMARQGRALPMALIAGVFFVLRQGLFLAASTPALAVCANLTLGPSFGLMTAAAVQYIYQISPAHRKSSAQAVANAAIYGVSGAVSNLLGGWLLDRMGPSAILLLGGLISAAAFAGYLLFLLTRRQGAGGGQGGV